LDNYQQYIATSRYARWLEDKGRRESWPETVERYIDFFKEKVADRVSAFDEQPDWDELQESITSLETMPSMRTLMTAGTALARDNVAGFNCSYLPIDHIRSFDELMYILMCGTGVGFSVERQYIAKLPEVAAEMHKTDTVIKVRDSKIGWASAFKELVGMLYSGSVPSWDVTGVRPSGARLKTFGGRASGPAPLVDLFDFTVELFRNSCGRRLSSIECHDLVCKIADIVVVGGVRRSALISLSNLTDDRMRRAKSGQWWEENGQRALANNSACYTEKPDLASFMKEWSSLYESRSGERGIFSRVASQQQAAKNGRRDSSFDFGTNPCSEIILRPNQFCNLSEVVVRSGDTFEDLKGKVKLATILGTLQSSLTDFRYLRPIWKRNTEEECLLGVSLTGIMDHPFLNNPDSYVTPNGVGHAWFAKGNMWTLETVLKELKEIAIETNREWAGKLGLNPSTAITCVKPSGTVSQLVNSASGIHPRFSPYYVRTVRGDKKDPLSIMMQEQGIPCEDDVMNPATLVFSFPQKAPDNAVCTSDVGAMEQLKLWKIYQDHWCEHKPSITVFYTDDEFLQAGAWLYENFDDVSGISFLPRSEHTYRQAPYQEITEEEYNKRKADMPEIQWDLLGSYEQEDNTIGSQELACSAAGGCEI
jgi:ribonucleoside-diphosphate reductase alpha chain